ncbi:MAG: NAAT family transporter [Proteobacteria bacterium]|nr:NAAT family transporter [Pseudomonadota bacterium]
MFAKIFISVFTIMGPFTVIPTFVSMTEGMSQMQIRHIAARALMVASSILIVSTIAGEKVFNLLGISLSSFKIAGGILILLMGINMLHAKRSESRATDSELMEAKAREDVSVFPLGTPLIAGPGAISTVILFSTGGKKVLSVLMVLAAVIISSVGMYYLLRYSRLIYKAIGETGTNIMMRLMGLILSAMAIEFIIDGIKVSFWG